MSDEKPNRHIVRWCRCIAAFGALQALFLVAKSQFEWDDAAARQAYLAFGVGWCVLLTTGGVLVRRWRSDRATGR